MFSNVNANETLLKTILIGQPEFRETLEQPEFRQLNQRVSTYYRLDPLSQTESGVYIQHRVQIAGGKPKIFSAPAIARIWEKSGGIPRTINTLCEMSLIYGFASDCRIIDETVVEEMLRDREEFAVEASALMISGHFPNAHVLTIQNGLGCEEMVSKYGDWPIISGVTFMSGTRHSDIHVEYELDTATWMGPWAETNARFEDVQQVESLFNQSGLIAEAYEDLLPHQWSKLIFNSAINSIAAITDLPHVKAFAKQDKLEDLGHLVFEMMNEARQIAEARGVKLADDPWHMNVNAVNKGSTSGEEYAHIPSMLDDVRSKRLTEIDWITGSIVREAKKAGVSAPLHETLYRLVKAFESSWTFGNKKH